MRKISRMASAILALSLIGTIQPLAPSAPSFRFLASLNGIFASRKLKLKQEVSADGVAAKLLVLINGIIGSPFFVEPAFQAALRDLSAAKVAFDMASSGASPTAVERAVELFTAAQRRVGELLSDITGLRATFVDQTTEALSGADLSALTSGSDAASMPNAIFTNYINTTVNKVTNDLSPEYTEDFFVGSFGLSLAALGLMPINYDFKIGLLLELGWDFGSITGSLKSSSTSSDTVDKNKVPDWASLNNGFSAKLGLAVEMYESFVAAIGFSLNNRTFKADKKKLEEYTANNIESKLNSSLFDPTLSTDYGKLEDQSTLVPGWFLDAFYFFNLNSDNKLRLFVRVGVFGDLGDATAKYPVSYKLDYPAGPVISADPSGATDPAAAPLWSAFTIEPSSTNDWTSKTNIGFLVGAGLSLNITP